MALFSLLSLVSLDLYFVYENKQNKYSEIAVIWFRQFNTQNEQCFFFIDFRIQFDTLSLSGFSVSYLIIGRIFHTNRSLFK